MSKNDIGVSGGWESFFFIGVLISKLRKKLDKNLETYLRVKGTMYNINNFHF
jgi:hypothetical protein